MTRRKLFTLLAVTPLVGAWLAKESNEDRARRLIIEQIEPSVFCEIELLEKADVSLTIGEVKSVLFNVLRFGEIETTGFVCLEGPYKEIVFTRVS